MNMNLSLLIPEFTALGVLMVLLVGEIFIKDFSARKAANVSFWGAVAVLAVLFFRAGAHGTAFGHTFRADTFSVFFKFFFILVMIPVTEMSRIYFKDVLKNPGEFFLILWSTLLGLFFLTSSNDFLLLFISLEIVTLSFYIMAAYLKKDLFSIEAGLKYLILGSLASAFFVYGISLIYVATGTLSLPVIREAFAAAPGNPLIILAILFLVAGIGFKVASVPFQLWVPDVYEGAPTPVVAFLSVGSKAAGFVIALRLLFGVFPAFDGRMMLFAILSALTLLYGNLGALVQGHIKRLFGYSSISHAGYLMIGIAAGGTEGAASLVFYLMAYGVSNLAAFLVIAAAGKSVGGDRIEHYRGLSKRSPFLAGVMFLALLSLAGIPPLAGFFGKFLVLLTAVRSGLTWLALLGALAVAVSLYYYLCIVKTMYVDEPAAVKPVAVSRTTKCILGLLAAAILVMGLWQGPFVVLAQKAVAILM